MLKYLYKTAFIAIFGVLSFQNSFAQCSIKTDLQVLTNSPVCLGSTAIVTIAGSESNKTYEIFDGTISVSSVFLGAGLNLTIPLRVLPAGSYTLTIKVGTIGCSSVELTQKAILVINSPPILSLSVTNNSPICLGNAAIVTVNSSQVGVAYQAFEGGISVSGVVLGTGGNLPIMLNTLSQGNHNISLRATVAGCGSVDLYEIITIVVNSPPVYPTPILIGDTVTLPTNFARVRIINPIAGQTYQAFKGGTPLASPVVGFGKEIEILIPVGTTSGLSVGTHIINIRNSTSGCGSIPLLLQTTIVVKPEIITSIEDKQITSNFAVYPNPFSSEITITSKLKGRLKLQITDAIGNIVHQESISNAQDLKLNLDLKSGLYFLQMESEGVRETVKLIK